MNPLSRLRSMLTKTNRVTTGLVVSNIAGELRVTTTDGVKVMSQTDATTYRSGDKVQVQGQIVTGKVASEDGVKVYTV